jgi:hypothetical protein
VVPGCASQSAHVLPLVMPWMQGDRRGLVSGSVEGRAKGVPARVSLFGGWVARWAGGVVR